MNQLEESNSDTAKPDDAKSFKTEQERFYSDAQSGVSQSCTISDHNNHNDSKQAEVFRNGASDDAQDQLAHDEVVETETLRESVYNAVVGATDLELAKRQYVDDEVDDDDGSSERNDIGSSRTKRLATGVSLPKVFNREEYSRDTEICEGNSNSDVDLFTFQHHGRENSENADSQTTNSDGIASLDAQQKQSDESEQLRKLFIGGLDYKTSEETLKRHFDRFGDVIDCVVMREPQSKRSRGFGFVIYANSQMVDQAQAARPHEVDGREVQSKRAISREDSGRPEAQATVRKVYLGGLSDDVEESELREYFSEFGNIININIVAHKDTGKRRGFAFVEYDDYDPVDKIVLKKFHTIKDKRVEAKKAIPKVEMDARKRVDPRTTMAGALMALSAGAGGPLPASLEGPPRGGRGGRSNTAGSGYLWDSPYGVNFHQGYPMGAPDGYPPHYHFAAGHYGASWMMHGGAPGGASPYGFRGSHGGGMFGRNGYSSQAAAVASAAALAATGAWPDYEGFPHTVSSPSSGTGPMRHVASYHHRGYRPYANGSGGHGGSIARNGRSYNP